jgi:hypothetical protein
MNNSEIEALPFGGWPLPDGYLTEIGRVAVLWSCLEGFLNLCLGKLAGFNEHGDPKPFILVNHSSFPQRLDMLGALCEHLVPGFPSLADYKTTISILRAAQRERNKFAHNGIGPGENAGEVVMTSGSARGSLKTNVQTITVADIRRAAIAISEAQRNLYKLVLGRDLPPAWQQDRQQQQS